MVKRLIKLFNREISGLHEAAYLLGFFAILSQLLALVRDRLLAYYFGAGTVLDIYYAGFRVPDFIFATLASLVSISVLVPFLTEKLNRNREEGKEFIDNIFSFFFLSVVVVSIMAYIFMPYVIKSVFFGFDVLKTNNVVEVARIMLLSPILLGLSNLFGSITQVYRRFFLYSISPLFYNLGIIFGIVVLYPMYGVKGLAFGVVIGALIHFLMQVPFVVSRGLWPKLKIKPKIAFIKETIFTSIPRTITLACTQLSTLIILSLASLVGVGAISIFNLAYNLQSVPLSIIGVSYSIAAFPTLARLFSCGQCKEFVEEVETSIKHIIFWSVPVVVLFIVLRAQIVRVVLGAGQFDWSDTRLTAASLALFVISVIFQSLNLLLVRAFYAANKTAKPMIVNVITAILSVTFAYLFYNLFINWDAFRYFLESLLRVENITNSAIIALPLGYSVGVIVGGIYLLVSFFKEYGGTLKKIIDTFFRSFCASIIMGFVAYLSLNLFDNYFNINSVFGIFMQGFLSGVVGIVFGVLVLWLLKSPELIEVWKTLHKKIWRVKTIPAEISEL